MQLRLIRYVNNQSSTLGALFIDDVFFCHTLEDEHRAVKVKGETRIPEGVYNVGLQLADTGLTLKYREKYPFFKHHIEIKNVLGFSGIYIHIGNNEKHTDGCVLLGDAANLNGTISNSTAAYKRFYEKIYPFLNLSGKVTLIIK